MKGRKLYLLLFIFVMSLITIFSNSEVFALGTNGLPEKWKNWTKANIHYYYGDVEITDCFSVRSLIGAENGYMVTFPYMEDIIELQDRKEKYSEEDYIKPIPEYCHTFLSTDLAPAYWYDNPDFEGDTIYYYEFEDMNDRHNFYLKSAPAVVFHFEKEVYKNSYYKYGLIKQDMKFRLPADTEINIGDYYKNYHPNSNQWTNNLGFWFGNMKVYKDKEHSAVTDGNGFMIYFPIEAILDEEGNKYGHIVNIKEKYAEYNYHPENYKNSIHWGDVYFVTLPSELAGQKLKVVFADDRITSTTFSDKYRKMEQYGCAGKVIGIEPDKFLPGYLRSYYKYEPNSRNYKVIADENSPYFMVYDPLELFEYWLEHQDEEITLTCIYEYEEPVKQYTITYYYPDGTNANYPTSEVKVVNEGETYYLPNPVIETPMGRFVSFYLDGELVYTQELVYKQYRYLWVPSDHYVAPTDREGLNALGLTGKSGGTKYVADKDMWFYGGCDSTIVEAEYPVPPKKEGYTISDDWLYDYKGKTYQHDSTFLAEYDEAGYGSEFISPSFVYIDRYYANYTKIEPVIDDPVTVTYLPSGRVEVYQKGSTYTFPEFEEKEAEPLGHAIMKYMDGVTPDKEKTIYWHYVPDYWFTPFGNGKNQPGDQVVLTYDIEIETIYGNYEDERYVFPLEDREDYKFICWTKTENSYADCYNYIGSTDDITLYALWEKNPTKYKVYYNGEVIAEVEEGGIYRLPAKVNKPSEQISTVTFVYNNGQENTTSAVYKQYIFSDWKIDDDNWQHAGEDINIYHDITIEPRYVENIIGAEFPEDPVKEGKTFTGWYDTNGAGGNKYTYYDGSINIYLYAHYNEPNPEPPTPGNIVCKKATTLHKEKCPLNYEDYTMNPACQGVATYTSGDYYVFYGTIPTDGQMRVGDAYTCDVNGDGTFDETTERFYYVSDYYDTQYDSYDDRYATLIYYTNVSGGVANAKNTYAYNSTGSAIQGPVTAMAQLPTVSQWNNNTLAYPLSKLTYGKSDWDTVPESATNLPYIDFSAYGARIATAKDITFSCGAIDYATSSDGVDPINDCNFLGENTYYTGYSSNKSDGYMLASVNYLGGTSDDPGYVFKFDTDSTIDNECMSWGASAGCITSMSASSKASVRPVIDVPRANIEGAPLSTGYHTVHYTNTDNEDVSLPYGEEYTIPDFEPRKTIYKETIFKYNDGVTPDYVSTFSSTSWGRYWEVATSTTYNELQPGDTIYVTSNVQITERYYTSSTYVTFPDDPVREGYIFDGWYTPEGYKVAKNNYYSTATTLTARWIKKKQENIHYIETSDIKCKRATTLHSAVCPKSKAGCWGYGSLGGKTLTYGNIHEHGDLAIGDAFTCDVNGDGVFDETTERFYYLSDYFDTNTKVFNSDVAALVYYTNVTEGEPALLGTSVLFNENNNYGVPSAAAAYLPTTEQWSNISLYETQRSINSAYESEYNFNFGIMDYSPYAARLLTYQELWASCDNSSYVDTTKCSFMFENSTWDTQQGTASPNMWLENHIGSHANDTNRFRAYRFNFYNRTIESTSSSSGKTAKGGVRPVIDVPKSNIEDIAYTFYYLYFPNNIVYEVQDGDTFVFPTLEGKEATTNGTVTLYYNDGTINRLVKNISKNYTGNAWKIGNDAYLPGDTIVVHSDYTVTEDYVETSAGVLLPTPEREGYEFVEWNTEANGSGTGYTTAYSGTDSISLYAQWRIPQDDDILCRRATTLHVLNYDETKPYGTLTNGTLKTGDAFDCDVNGDGEFDPDDERFYYVSDYYNTETKTFDHDYAALIWYKNSPHNTDNYVDYYLGWEVEEPDYLGPLGMSLYMPTTDTWSNVKLKDSTRTITPRFAPENAFEFDYTGYAARLLTTNELEAACNVNLAENGSYVLPSSCDYLYESIDHYDYEPDYLTGSYWLEDQTDKEHAFSVQLGYVKSFPIARSEYWERNIHPVIDVPKSRMDYDMDSDVISHKVTFPDGTYTYVEHGAPYTFGAVPAKDATNIATVTFKPENGSADITRYVTKQSIGDGWSIGSSHYAEGDQITVLSDITLKYNYVEVNSGVVFPQDPAKEGYDFAGWFNSAEGGKQYTSYSGTKDITLYAQYTDSIILPDNTMTKDDEVISTVTFKYHNGQADTTSNVVRYYVANGWLVNGEVHQPGESIERKLSTLVIPYFDSFVRNASFPANPTNNGEEFIGWFTEEEGGEQVTVLNSEDDLVLHAHYSNDYALLKTGQEISDILWNYSIANSFRKANATEFSNAENTSIISTDDSPKPVYVWKANNEILYYSEAPVIYLNPDSSYLFNNTGYYTTDVSGLNSSKVTNMDHMFASWRVENIILGNFDTSSATDMTMMFFGTKVTTLDLSSFDTSNVETMEGMFWSITSLQTVDVSSFDTHNVKNMRYMFATSSDSLTELDLSSFDTSNVIDMDGMLANNYAIEELDLSTFNTQNVEDMSYMFADNRAMKRVNLSSFDTRNVKSFSQLFYDCPALEEVDLSNFNTESLYDISAMFYGDTTIEEIDLSSFDTTSVISSASAFAGASNLKTIYVSDKWSMDNILTIEEDGEFYDTSQGMFDGAVSIVGQEGTTYDENHTNKEYAHVDGGVDNPGYLTYKENNNQPIGKPLCKKTYGTEGVLETGDEFACDVNGDGIYDDWNEKFYYVSEYYDTMSGTFINTYATLIYAYNVYHGGPSYVDDMNTSCYAGSGWSCTSVSNLPTAVLRVLPTTEQWSNVKLFNESRFIRTVDGVYVDQDEWYNSEFQYEGAAARLLTVPEVERACNVDITSSNYSNITLYTHDCDFLTENLEEALGEGFMPSYNYYLENPIDGHLSDVNPLMISNSGLTDSVMDGTGVRPVIDVQMSKLQLTKDKQTHRITYPTGDYENVEHGSTYIFKTLPTKDVEPAATVTFNYNKEGVEPTTSTVNKQFIGYGWKINEDSYVVGSTITVNNDITLAYDYVETYSGAEFPADPVWENHTFEGWYDEDGNQYEEYDGTRSITLYAKWSSDLETYTVTYDDGTIEIYNDGDIITVPTSTKVKDIEITFDWNNGTDYTQTYTFGIYANLDKYIVNSSDEFEPYDTITVNSDLFIQRVFNPESLSNDIVEFPLVNSENFIAWFTQPEGGKAYRTIKQYYLANETADTLYAQYTVDGKHAVILDGVKVAEVNHGDTYTLPTGVDFDEDIATVTFVNGETTTTSKVHANKTFDYYNVSNSAVQFYPTDSIVVNETIYVTSAYSDEVITPVTITVLADNDYQTFDAWYDRANGKGNKYTGTYNGRLDITLYANFIGREASESIYTNEIYGYVGGGYYRYGDTVDYSDLTLDEYPTNHKITYVYQNNTTVNDYSTNINSSQKIHHLVDEDGKVYGLVHTIDFVGYKGLTVVFESGRVVNYTLDTYDVEYAYPGHTFLGWYTEPEGGERIFKVTEDKDITVYAHWKKNDEGFCEYSNGYTENCYEGDTLRVPTTMSVETARVYYNLNAEGDYAANGMYSLYYYDTLYRVDYIESYVINGKTYYPGDEYILGNENYITVNVYKSVVQPIEIPVLYGAESDWFENAEDYIFAGWYDQVVNGNLYTEAYAGTENITLYAHWLNKNDNPDTVTLTYYDLDGNENIYTLEKETVYTLPEERLIIEQYINASYNYPYSYEYKEYSLVNSYEALTFNVNNSILPVGTKITLDGDLMVFAIGTLTREFTPSEIEDPQLPGKYFLGWYEYYVGDEETAKYDLNNLPYGYEDIYMYSRYVEYDPNEEVIVDFDGEVTVYPKGSEIELPTDRTKEDDTFIIYLNDSYGNEEELPVNRSYTLNKYTVNGVNKDKGTTIVVNENTTIRTKYNIAYSYVNDDNYPELPTLDYKDQIFEGWYTSLTGGTKVEDASGITDTTTIYARFAGKVKLTVDGYTTYVNKGTIYTVPTNSKDEGSFKFTLDYNCPEVEDLVEETVYFGKNILSQTINGSVYFPGETYVVNHETVVVSKKGNTDGTTLVPEINVPQRDGYTLLGWKDSMDNYMNFDTITVDDRSLIEGNTFVAQWTDYDPDTDALITYVDDVHHKTWKEIVSKGATVGANADNRDNQIELFIHTGKTQFITYLEIRTTSTLDHFEIDGVSYAADSEVVVNDDITINLKYVDETTYLCNNREPVECPAELYAKPGTMIDGRLFKGVYTQPFGKGALVDITKIKGTDSSYHNKELYIFYDPSNEFVTLTVDGEVSIIPKGLGNIPAAKTKASETYNVIFNYNDGTNNEELLRVERKYTFSNYYVEGDDYYDALAEYDYQTDTTMYSQYNTEVIYPAMPRVEKASFIGWYTAPNGGDKVSTLRNITKDTILYARYDNVPVNIYIDGVKTEVAYGSEFTLPTGTNKADKTINITLDHDYSNITENKTITTSYEFTNYTMDDTTYEAGYTFTATEDKYITSNYTSSTSMSPEYSIPTRDGYEFISWMYNNNEIDPTTITAEDENYNNKTFTANWAAKDDNKVLVIYDGKRMVLEKGTGVSALGVSPIKPQNETYPVYINHNDGTNTIDEVEVTKSAELDKYIINDTEYPANTDYVFTEDAIVTTTYKYNYAPTVASVLPEGVEGIFTQPYGGELVDSFDGIAPEQTLYAHWSVIHTITLDGEIIARVEHGNTYTLPTNDLFTSSHRAYVTLHYQYDGKEDQQLEVTYEQSGSAWKIGDLDYFNGQIIQVNQDIVLTRVNTSTTSPVAIPQSVSRSGYTFKGFYTDPVAGELAPTSYDGNVDVEYYAHWAENEYITYPDGEIIVVPVGDTFTLKNGQDDPIENYNITFKYNYENSPADKVVPITAQNKFVKWIVNGVEHNSGDVITVEGPVTIEADYNRVINNATIPADPTRDGYAFTGWYSRSGNNGTLVDVHSLTKTTTVYAHWANYDPETQVQLDWDGVITIHNKGEEIDLFDSNKQSYNEKVATITFIMNQEGYDNKKVYVNRKYSLAHYLINGDEHITYGTYTLNEDTTIESVYTNAILAPELPIVNDQRFKGFYTALTDGSQVTTLEGIVHDVTYYAQWETETVPVIEDGEEKEIIKGTTETIVAKPKANESINITLDYNHINYNDKTVRITTSYEFDYYLINGQKYYVGDKYTYLEPTEKISVYKKTTTNNFEGYSNSNWDLGLSVGSNTLTSWKDANDANFDLNTLTGETKDYNGNTYTANYSELSNETVSVKIDDMESYDWPIGEQTLIDPDLELNLNKPADTTIEVTFDLNNGTGNSIKRDIDVTYNFSFFTVDGNGQYQRNDTYNFYKDTIIQSQYEEAYTYPELPTIEDANFIGWYTKATDGKVVTSLDGITEPVTLYAHYSVNGEHTIYFDGVAYTYDDFATIVNPVEEGYASDQEATYTLTFDYQSEQENISIESSISKKHLGWADENNRQYGENINLTDTNLGVYFTSRYNEGAHDYILVSAADPDDSTFIGWFTEPEGGNRVTGYVEVTNRILYAHYGTVEQVTVTIDGVTSIYDKGSEVTLPNNDYLQSTSYDITFKPENGDDDIVVTVTEQTSGNGYIDDSNVAFASGSTVVANTDLVFESAYTTTTTRNGEWPTNPTRDNYTFAGWYTHSQYGSEVTSFGEISTKTNLYARWNEIDSEFVTLTNTKTGNTEKLLKTEQYVFRTSAFNRTQMRVLGNVHFVFNATGYPTIDREIHAYGEPSGYYVNYNTDVLYDMDTPVTFTEDAYITPYYDPALETSNKELSLGSFDFNVLRDGHNPVCFSKTNFADGVISEDSDYTCYTEFDEENDDDITVYLLWSKAKITVTNPDGTEEEYEYGDEYTFKTLPTKNNENVAVVTFKPENGSADITSYVVKSYTATDWVLNGTHYNAGDKITLTENIQPIPQYIETITGATFPVDPEKEHYVFEGWFNNDTKYTSYEGTEDITLTARYTSENIIETDPEGNEIEHNYGDEVTLPVNDIAKVADLTIVTFVPNNGEDDYIAYVTQVYTPNGWLINGVHYDDGATYTVTENYVRIPDYTYEIIPVTFPNDPVKENYSFEGWYSGEDRYTSYALMDSLVLTARWKGITITETDPEGNEIEHNYGDSITLPENDMNKVDETANVTFVYGNGSNNTYSSVVKKFTPNGWLINGVHYDDGATYTVTENYVRVPDYTFVIIPALFPNNPEREHYSFDGWYKENTKYTSYAEMVDIILTAKWTGAPIQVCVGTDCQEVPYGTEYDLGKNNIAVPSETSTVTFIYHDGVTPDETQTAVKSYIPYGWLVNGVNYNDDATITITESITIEPNYSYNYYTVYVPDYVERENYHFMGWYLNDTEYYPYDYYDVGEDIVLHAHWNPEEFEVCINGDCEYIEYGTEYQLGTNNIAKSNANIATVTFKPENGDEDTIRYVQKSFTANGWLVNDVHYNDNATITITSDTTIEPDYADTIIGVNFPEDPEKEHYVFEGWFNNDTKYTSYNGSEDLILTAEYSKEKITVTNPDGTEEEYEYGDEYTFKSLPTKNDENVAVVTFKPENGSADITRYVTKSYTAVDWVLNGTHYNAGTKITLTENIQPIPQYTETITGAEFPADPEKEHYVFEGWFNNDVKYTEYEGTADIILTAEYSKEKIIVTEPDGEHEYEYGDEYEFKATPAKDNENIALVTFKPENGEDDIERYVQKTFTPYGWMIGDTHYNEGDKIELTENIQPVPYYVEVVNGVEFPEDPEKEFFTFEGWYNTDTKYTSYSGTEDLILTAVWSEAGPTSITINTTNMVIVKGETKDVDITTDPINLNQYLTYTGYSDIITVSEDGEVEAIEVGETTITVSTTNRPEISETINVKVINNVITSDTLTVDTRDLGRIIIGANENTTIEDFLAYINNDAEYLEVYNVAGDKVTDYDELITTGARVKLVIDDHEYDEVIVIIRGDIDQDGIIDVSDKLLIKRHILLFELIEDYRLYAADLDYNPEATIDDMIDVSDNLTIAQYILGKIKSLNPELPYIDENEDNNEEVGD